MNDLYKRFVAEKLHKSGFSDIKNVPKSEYLIATAKNGAKVCIYCDYSEFTVDADEIESFAEVKSTFGCSAAMIITNARLTDEAKESAAAHKVIVKENIIMPDTGLVVSPEKKYETPTVTKKQKTKPFYKKIWFWCATILFGVVLYQIGTSGDSPKESDNTKITENTETDQKPSKKQETQETYAGQIPVVSAPSTSKVVSKNEYIDKCKEYNYSDIARSPEQYTGEYIKIEGTVIQVTEGWLNSIVLRVECGGDDIWYVKYTKTNDKEKRILENDWITAYGTCNGVETYTSVLGSTVTIPSMTMKYYDISNTAETPENIEYQSYSVTELITDYDSNKMKAKDKYYGEYVELVGRLGTIASSGEYIELYPGVEEYEWDSIRCYIKTDTVKSSIFDMAVGNTIVVRGKITDVNDYPGYELDITETYIKY